MPDPWFDKAAILGVGLIGGSLGLALRERGLAGRVSAYSRTAATRRLAVDRGAADEAPDSPQACVAGADLVYLAPPVATIVPLLAQVLPALRDDCLITDAGSSKREIVDGAEALDLGGRGFVGGHPMAGSESMGIEHARGDLFEGMSYVLTPTERTRPEALAAARALATAVGSTVYQMSPERHDSAVAAVSHLPHLAAVALMMVTQRRHESGQPVYDLTAGGWASGTRVAAGGARLWRDILASNRAAVLAALADGDRALAELKRLLAEGRDDELEALLETVRESKLAHPGR